MYRDIIYKCDSSEDVINAENVGKKYGWDWNNNNNISIYRNISQCGYLVFSIDVETKKKSMFYQNDIPTEEVISNLITLNEGNYVIVDTLVKLERLLREGYVIKIEYNTPRKLVYENKILKFNNYNK